MVLKMANGWGDLVKGWREKHNGCSIH